MTAMIDFLKKVWQWILKLLSVVFKNLFATQIKNLVNEVLTATPVTKDKEVLFDFSSVTIDIASDETIRSEIINYFLEITKDCDDRKLINKTLLLLNTVSISVLKSIKNELLVEFDRMFSEPLCEEDQD